MVKARCVKCHACTAGMLDAGGSESVYKQYVWDLRYIDAPVLRWWDANGDGDLADENETLYYTNDANMNVTAVVNTSGQVVERYSYDPYGRVTVRNGAGGVDPDVNGSTVFEWDADDDGASDVGNAILYAGYLYDDETGLFHVRNRTHHPTLGRWLQRDPAGYVDGMSLYEYVSSSPTAEADAYGLSAALFDELAQILKDDADYAPCTLGDLAEYLTVKRLGSGAFKELVLAEADAMLGLAQAAGAIFGGGPALKWTLETASWIKAYYKGGIEELIKKGIFKAASWGAGKGLRSVLNQSEAGRELARRLAEEYDKLSKSALGRLAKDAGEDVVAAAKQEAWEAARDKILGTGNNKFIEEHKIWKMDKKEYKTQRRCEDTCGGKVSGSVVWVRYAEAFRPQIKAWRGGALGRAERVDVTVYATVRGQFVGVVCDKGDWKGWSLTISANATEDVSYEDWGAPVLARKSSPKDFNPTIGIRGDDSRPARKRRRDQQDSGADPALDRLRNRNRYIK